MIAEVQNFINVNTQFKVVFLFLNIVNVEFVMSKFSELIKAVLKRKMNFMKKKKNRGIITHV